MGFLDTIKSVLGGAIAGGLTGGPLGAAVGATGAFIGGAAGVPAVQTTAAALTQGVSPAGAILTGLPAITGPIVAQALPGIAQAVLPSGQVVPQVMGMKNVTQTIVQTLNPAGQLIRQVILRGRPFLMRRDFVNLKRTMKLIRQANARLGGRRAATKKQKEEAEQLGLLKGLAVAGNETATALAVLDSDD